MRDLKRQDECNEKGNTKRFPNKGKRSFDRAGRVECSLFIAGYIHIHIGVSDPRVAPEIGPHGECRTSTVDKGTYNKNGGMNFQYRSYKNSRIVYT
jgi:hypothetical protein